MHRPGDRLVFWALLAAEAVVLALDLTVFWGAILPTLFYAVPVLAAAPLLPARRVALLAAAGIAAHLAAAIIEPGRPWVSAAEVLGTATASLLSIGLAARIQRETAARQGAQVALDRLHREQSAREALHRAIERQASELAAIVSSMPAGVLIYDAEGRISHVNAAAELMLSHDEESRGLPLPARISRLNLETAEGEPLEPGETPFRRALAGEVVAGAVLTLNTAGREPSSVNVAAAPIVQDGIVQGAVVTLTDITEHRRLQARQEELLQTISHDLRTPLSAIQLQGEMLERHGRQRGDAVVTRQAGAIVVAGKRLGALIADLVDSARLDSGQLRLRLAEVEPRRFLEDVTTRLGHALDLSRVRLDVGDAPRGVLADVGRLERVVVNLLTNALKYSDPGTPIVVRACADGGELRISVADRGPGIPAPELPHLFDRFRRGHAGEGLGLGLYIARRLVEEHGGRIWAESAEGQGTTFTIALPARAPPDAAAAPT